MEDEKMCNQRFILLLVWCGGLSVAVVVMSITQLTARHNTQDQAKDNIVQMQNEPKSQLAPPSLPTGRPLSHIHLTIMGSNLTLMEDLPPRFASTSRLLVLRNNSVYVSSGGFYHFYAHVTFGPVLQSTRRMVALIRNAIPGQLEEKSLSEAVNWGEKEGSLSISQTIKCQKGQSLRLEIRPQNAFRENAQYTYWGLFLLTAY